MGGDSTTTSKLRTIRAPPTRCHPDLNAVKGKDPRLFLGNQKIANFRFGDDTATASTQTNIAAPAQRTVIPTERSDEGSAAALGTSNWRNFRVGDHSGVKTAFIAVRQRVAAIEQNRHSLEQVNVLGDVGSEDSPQVGSLLVREESLWNQMEGSPLHLDNEKVTDLSRALHQ